VHQLLLLVLSYCPATQAERDGFTVCYDKANQRALWTSHRPAPASAPSSRRHWRKDNELNSQSPKAFTHTGFHRGHLVPAADRPESADIILTSNAIPQDPALNAGAWRRLENQIRKHGADRVLTGAVYNNCGNEQIEAPCYIYKIAILADGQLLAEFARNAAPR
jgi:endonuclease G